MRRRWLSRLLTVALLSLLLSGCWDGYGLADRAAALVLYVVPASGKNLRWTFYMADPTATAGSIVNISSQQQFYTKTVNAPSLAQAYSRAAAELSRYLYLGQLEDILIASTVSVRHVNALIQDYNRVGDWPHTVYVLAVHPSATPFPVTTHQPVPDVYYTRYFTCKSCQPLDLARQEWKVWDDFETPGVSMVVPFAQTLGRPDRILVYTREAMIPFTRRDTLGWAVLSNHVAGFTVPLSVQSGQCVIRRVRTRTSMRVSLAHGRLYAKVRITARGDLVRWPSNTSLSAMDMQEVESALSRYIAHLSAETVDADNRTGTDPVGFGRWYLFHHPLADQQWAGAPGKVWPVHATVVVSSRVRGIGDNT